MALTFISTQTASSSSTLSFTSGIDSTYDSYEFHFVNMHPSVASNFSFQVNAVSQTGFNEVITSSTYRAYHNEVDTSANLQYRTGSDQAQGTAYQTLAESVPTDADQSVSGILTLYAPSDTTYVKHFTGVVFGNFFGAATGALYVGGYINTTSAIDEVSFKFASGNIDTGNIHMYGVS
jgi:hypothetical protein